jgi:hypothetical protein
VLFQGGLITELVSFNERIHATVEDLHARLKTMETIGTPMLQKHHSAPAGTFPLQPAFNFRPSGDVRSRSPSPDHENYRVRDAPPRSRKARKNLAIKVPENKNASPAIGLPTPMTVSQVYTPPRLAISMMSMRRSCMDISVNTRLTNSRLRVLEHRTPHLHPAALVRQTVRRRSPHASQSEVHTA